MLQHLPHSGSSHIVWIRLFTVVVLSKKNIWWLLARSRRIFESVWPIPAAITTTPVCFIVRRRLSFNFLVFPSVMHMMYVLAHGRPAPFCLSRYSVFIFWKNEIHRLIKNGNELYLCADKSFCFSILKWIMQHERK